MFRITRDRNAPFEGAAADGEIAQAAFDEGNDFVAARLRADEARVLLVVREQFVGKGGKLEVVVFFADRLGRAAALRAGSAGPHSVNIKLVEDAVLAGISSFIYVAFFLDALPQLLRATLMARLSGADEVIVGDAHFVKERAKFGGNFVHPLLRRGLGFSCRAFDLYAVLVRAGQQVSIKTQHALAPGNRVTDQCGVGVADVWTRVYVVNGRGDVKLFF